MKRTVAVVCLFVGAGLCLAFAASLEDEVVGNGQTTDKCSNVKCQEDIPCPADSYKLPSVRHPDECCSVPGLCECLPRSCDPPDCDDGVALKLHSEVTGKPGACCPEYKCVNETEPTCMYGGEEYRNGEQWHLNKCHSCECRDGLTFCQAKKCDTMPPCGRMAVPDGECCAVCIGCMSHTGKFYNNSDTWKEDSCTTCTCEEGQRRCQAEMCQVTCTEPELIPDQCCPKCSAPTLVTISPNCPSMKNCSVHCMNGLTRDEVGCHKCECKLDICELDCPHGYVEDESGSEICRCRKSLDLCPPIEDCKKDCSHGYKVDKDGCQVCKCSRCKKLKGCVKHCPAGFLTNDRGCPICKCREDVNVSTTTTTTDRPVLETTSLPAIPRGIPCRSTESHMYDEGQSWHDGCRTCYCHGGLEMCDLITCPVPQCEHPMFLERDCCPKCLEDNQEPVAGNMTVCQAIDGFHYVEGETWNMDRCTKCICHEGRVLCHTQQCPPAPCKNPIRKQGECCLSCTENSISESSLSKLSCQLGDEQTSYQHGGTWRVGVCQSCLCQHGKIRCFSETCPKLPCSRPVLRKNQCCPVCLEQKQTHFRCESDGRNYTSGEKWNPSECVQCMCLSGRIKCTEKQCATACDNPVKIPGQCCPTCRMQDAKHRTDDKILPKNVDISIYSGLDDTSTADVTKIGYSSKVPINSDDQYQVTSNHQSQYFLMAIIVFVIVVVCLVAIVTVLFIIMRRLKQDVRRKDVELQNVRKARPKSTNVDLQAAFNTLLQQNLEKGKCDPDYMPVVNTYTPVRQV